MKIVNNAINKFISKTADKNFYDKFNRNIPIIETAFSGICYAGAIYLNKNLDKDRKPSLYWQTLLGCIFGMTVSKKIDNSINTFKNNVCKELKVSNIDRVDKVVNSFKIVVPLLTVATVTRFAVPVLIAPFSTKIEEYRKKKLDIKG